MTVGVVEADSYPSLQAALNLGKRVWLTPGTTYTLPDCLHLPNNSGLISDGTAKLYMPASVFDNTSLAYVDRYADNSVGINCSGQLSGSLTPSENILLKGFKIEHEAQDGRVLRSVLALNAKDFVCDNVEIYGGPVGGAIELGSVFGDTKVQHCRIHDFTDNYSGWASQPQITGIIIDDTIYNGASVEGIDIFDNRIWNLTVGAAVLAAYGYQTDGINMVRNTTKFVRATYNKIRNVGECIDNFSSQGEFSHNTLRDAYYFALKFIHGPQHNLAAHNLIDGAGIAGILVQGSSTSGVGHTEGNSFVGNKITGIDRNNLWSSTTTACIKTVDAGLTYKCVDNVFTGNVLSPGSIGDYAIADHAGTPQTWQDNSVLAAGTAGRTFSSSGLSHFKDSKTTNVRVYLAADQTISAGSFNKVTLNTKSADARGEFDATTNFRWVCQVSGWYDFEAAIRYESVDAGSVLSIQLRRNNVEVSRSVYKVSETEQTITLTDKVYFSEGQYAELFTHHNNASGRVISGDATYGARLVVSMAS